MPALIKEATGNFEIYNEVVASGKNIYLVGAHLFNWEYANLVISRHINLAADRCLR